MERPEIALLVTDIDNTLFDWVSSWAACVPSLVDAIATELGVDGLEAEQRVRDVHRAWGMTECPSCVTEILGGGAASDRTIREYEARLAATRPVYGDVPATLERIRAHGVRVAGYTESHRDHTLRRLRLFGLSDLVEILYSDQQKPDPATLRVIAADTGTELTRVLYVGDNLWKDVAMAQRAGVHAAWAQYGTRRAPDADAWLARLCHWSASDTAGERAAAAGITAAVALERGLAELLDRFRFVPHD